MGSHMNPHQPPPCSQFPASLTASSVTYRVHSTVALSPSESSKPSPLMAGNKKITLP